MSQDELDLWSDINNPNNDADMDDWADAHNPNNDSYAHPELEERWFDVNYYDLVEDPMGVIGAIHEHFGWTLEQAAIDAMTDWRFRQAAHRQRETRHRYALENYGLAMDAVNAAFARYREFLTTQGIRSLRN
jgi:hypothetical protein